MTTIDWVQILSASVLPLTIAAVVITRWVSGKGLGVRVVQFVRASMMFPTIIILSTRQFLSGETAAALIGALVGYLFANISNYDSQTEGFVKYTIAKLKHLQRTSAMSAGNPPILSGVHP